jgi:flagellar basal-body rod protein FlgB
MMEHGINPFVEKMLDHAARRQEALSDNISNLDTPGYRAKDVQFHNELAGAFSVEDTEAEEEEKPNGNTVNLETQMTSLTQNGLQYMTLIQFLSSNVQSIKYAITEGGKS